MSLRNPICLLLSNLIGRLDIGRLDYCTPEEAHELLAQMVGCDFGYDAQRWNEWLIKIGWLKEGEYTVLPSQQVG